MGGFPLVEIVGVVVGHLYFFLTELYPRNSGKIILTTPSFLHSLFPDENREARRGVWGRGYRLNN